MNGQIVADDTPVEGDSIEPSPTEWPSVDRRKNDRRQWERRRSARRAELAELTAAVKCTSREIQTLQLVLEGMTNKQIANRLGIVEDTVKKHLQHLYTKLGVRRRAMLILGGASAVNTVQPRERRRTTFVE